MDRPGGPREAPHRLLLSEKKAILARAALEAHADASSRVLAYQALDEGVFAVSPSSVYRTLAAEALAVVRGPARRKARTTKPLREELTGPNQRWCWDISYLRTPSKRSFLFLYVMLDEWSRKVVAWLVAEFESYELGKILMDRALASEGLQSLGAQLPVVINDRGASMKAKNLKQFFVDLGVTQRFSRPRTPDDNPFVEAHFRTVKYHPQYPEHFEDVVRVSGITILDGLRVAVVDGSGRNADTSPRRPPLQGQAARTGPPVRGRLLEVRTDGSRFPAYIGNGNREPATRAPSRPACEGCGRPIRGRGALEPATACGPRV
jgi:transposase InsO family protein